jgi:hypothetical protein
VPEDLLAALEAEPRAKAFFATINAANRYAVLWRIHTAVKAETRARRIAQLVEMLARGETIPIFKPSAKANRTGARVHVAERFGRGGAFDQRSIRATGCTQPRDAC